ncbi:MAG TPA: hypothetical protein VLJ76_07915 [Gaiellaceae bacterium]|nr:hypothetical protein [Gaiellaceae bacterium]
MRKRVLLGVLVVLAVAVTVTSTPASRISAAQALRTCVDRWNQDHMLGWGPTLVSISIRRLDVREEAHVGIYDRTKRCTVSLAVFWPRSHPGCSGGAVESGRPNFCVETTTTSVCVGNQAGGYWCSRYADGDPPLRNRNATTDPRGVLTLDVPLSGTRATPPLSWQRRYQHIDGYIHPWTAAGTLRRGLTFAGQYRGTCIRGSEQTHDASALRCYSNGWFDPCFAPTRNRHLTGGIVACADAGSTTFVRFILKHF